MHQPFSQTTHYDINNKLFGDTRLRYVRHFRTYITPHRQRRLYCLRWFPCLLQMARVIWRHDWYKRGKTWHKYHSNLVPNLFYTFFVHETLESIYHIPWTTNQLYSTNSSDTVVLVLIIEKISKPQVWKLFRHTCAIKSVPNSSPVYAASANYRATESTAGCGWVHVGVHHNPLTRILSIKAGFALIMR